MSAFCAESIVSVGKTDETKRRLKADLKNRAELLKIGLLHISEPYNPLSAALANMMGDQLEKNIEHDDMLENQNQEKKGSYKQLWIARNFDTVNKHRSSA